MNSDTPLTDAAAGYPDGYGYWRYNDLGLYVSADFARDLERRLAASCEDARAEGMGCLLINHYEHRLKVASALLTRARNNVSLPMELYSDIQNFLNAP